MIIRIPETALVILIGASGSGKSTFARKHFKPTEVLSSDFCRGLVADDENDQTATDPAFEVLHFIARKRLQARRLTVVDATNVQKEARQPLIALAREMHCLPVAIVLNLSEKECREHNSGRSDRNLGRHVVRQQVQQLKRSLRGLKREGLRHISVLGSVAEIEAATIERQRLWNDRRDDHGPFDIIGDVHGCAEELRQLLAELGYVISGTAEAPAVEHPDGRKAVFLGDLVDRGPDTPGVLRLVMAMVASGTALCVPGNHDIKLMKKLRGKDVRLTHGLAESLAQLEGEPEELLGSIRDFLDGLISHYVLDDGKLVVAHAGLPAELQGRASARVRQFCLYGETTGETDELGLPVRYNWAADYRGRTMVVYGHTPVPEADWLNGTICIDTGCVFGGRLTAIRYPEREIVDVPAAQVYYDPVRPLDGRGGAPADAERAGSDLLDIGDVTGKRIITTRLHKSVTIRDDSSVAALEVMSRFGADPRWLIYLPPTMAAPDTAKEGRYLEHPTQVLDYYRHNGVARIICQEKHMGSRAIAVVCRDETVAASRFGIAGDGCGAIISRTGRPFFRDRQMTGEVLERLRRALDRAGFWDRFATGWVCLDTELMPWSAKAQELLLTQYAPAGSSSRASLAEAAALLEQTAERGVGAAEMAERYRQRLQRVERYTEAYRRYCWPVSSLTDLKIAPFHLMATEGQVHIDQAHQWHMEVLAELCAADPELLQATQHLLVDLTDPESEAAAVDWWLQLTEKGGEGMVVKPLDWIVRGRRGLVQPAVKCRGREYLRIIYGPEYTAPEHIERLRSRSLGRKRSLALRELALGLEALHRFVEGEPLYRVHECVFGVLALESEPVDPRL
jgi:protein phosphatase